MADGYTHDPEAFDEDDEYANPAADGKEDAEHPETADREIGRASCRERV